MAKAKPTRPRYNKWRWQLPPEKHQKILEYLRKGVGILRTAQLVGVGVKSVQKRVELLRDMERLELEKETGD